MSIAAASAPRLTSHSTMNRFIEPSFSAGSWVDYQQAEGHAATLTARIRNLPKSADGVQALGRPPPREASSLRPHRRSVPVVRRPERRRSPTPSAAEPRHRPLSGDRQGKRDENDRDAFHASG